MKKVLISISLLAGFTVLSFAGDGAGSVAMPFVEIPHNSVSLAEGGTRLARPSSMAYGAFENIAALPFSTSKMEFSAAYQKWAPSQTNEGFISFGTGAKLGSLALSLSGTLGSHQPYTEYREGGFEGSTFTPKDVVVGLGAAYGISDAFGIGLSAKYLSNTLSSSASYTAFCADVMGYGQFGPVGVGAGVRNLGSKVKSYSGTSYSLPMSLSAGAAYESEVGVGAALDVDVYLGGGFDLGLGGHYCWNDMISVRCGYHLGSVLPSFFAVGAGFQIVGIHLDATYVVAPALASGSLCVGLGYRF